MNMNYLSIYKYICVCMFVCVYLYMYYIIPHRSASLLSEPRFVAWLQHLLHLLCPPLRTCWWAPMLAAMEGVVN